MDRLLIIQNYNANKGDSSVAHAMTKSLKQEREGLEIAITSYDPRGATEEYGVDSAEWIFSYRNIKLSHSMLGRFFYMFREGCWFLYSIIWLAGFRAGLKLPVPLFKRKTIDLYLSSDVVVLPGGHFFTNLNGFPTIFSHFYGLLFAIILGKKTMIYAETIGPFFGKFGPITKAMTRYIMKKVDMVTVREKDSLKYCEGIENAHLTAECVFALESEPDLASELPILNTLKQNGRLLVGVTIHHIYYKHFFTKAKYVACMAGIFERIIDEFNANILIIPMEDSCHGGGDRPIAQEMIADMDKHGDRVHILEGDHDPMFIASVISNVDLLVGTKTHSIVYGLKGGVPTVSISYQQKSNEFMEMFGLSQYAIDLKVLTVDRFMEIFAKAVVHMDNISSMQKEALDHVRPAALENNRLLVTLFGTPQ